MQRYVRLPRVALGLGAWALLSSMLVSAAEPVALRAENLLVLPSHASLTFVTVQNLQASPYAGTVSLRAPDGWRLVPPQREVQLQRGETKRVPFSVEQARDRAENAYPVEVSAAGAGVTVVRKQQIVCVSAPYFKPVIDGDTSEWKDAIPVTFVTAGKKTVVSTYWNRNQLALLVAVEEDQLVPYREGAGAGAFDAVQIAIAPQGSVTGRSAEGAATRWEFLLAATGQGRGGKCFQLAQPGAKLSDTQQARSLAGLECEAAQVAVRREGALSYYECAIPWKPMRDEIRPSEGREFCLSLLVHDPDGTGLRDWGQAAGLWPSQRNRLAWSNWQGAQWGPEPPWDNKVEWGLCASKY